jgi:hypothetical protein
VSPFASGESIYPEDVLRSPDSSHP